MGDARSKAPDTVALSLTSALKAADFLYRLTELAERRKEIPRTVQDRLDRWIPVFALVEATQATPGSLGNIDAIINFQQYVLSYFKTESFMELEQFFAKFSSVVYSYGRPLGADVAVTAEKRANSVTNSDPSLKPDIESSESNLFAPFTTLLGALHTQLPEVFDELFSSPTNNQRFESFVSDAQHLFALASQCGGDMRMLYNAAAPLIQFWTQLKTAPVSTAVVPKVYQSYFPTHCHEADMREQSHTKLFQAVARILHKQKNHLFPGLEDIVSSWKTITGFQFSNFRFLGREKPFLHIYARCLAGRSRIVSVHYDPEDPDKIVFTEDETALVKVHAKFTELCQSLSSLRVILSDRTRQSIDSDTESDRSSSGDEAVENLEAETVEEAVPAEEDSVVAPDNDTAAPQDD